MATQAEWEIIEAAYIARKGSYAKLSAQFNVSLTTLKKKAIAGNWKLKRDETDTRIDTKVIEKIAEHESNKRVDELFDAIAHLDKVINDCQVASAQVAPKSWESLMSVLLKAIAMRQELTPKAAEFDDDGWD
jgi:hypothetical protein